MRAQCKVYSGKTSPLKVTARMKVEGKVAEAEAGNFKRVK
jgi:hypothetical protein